MTKRLLSWRSRPAAGGAAVLGRASQARPYVAVIGNIGSGKSTTVGPLAAALGVDPLYDGFEKNPYLERFYQDPSVWAFRSQLWFLVHVAGHQYRVVTGRTGGVQERFIHDIFEVMTTELRDQRVIGETDYVLARDLTRMLSCLIPVPDVLLYLDVEPRAALQRIQQRGRRMEETISVDYLVALGERYKLMLSRWTLCPSVTVDSDAHDPRTEAGLRHIVTAVVTTLRQSRKDERRQ